MDSNTLWMRTAILDEMIKDPIRIATDIGIDNPPMNNKFAINGKLKSLNRSYAK